jgi:hypothetical protein
MAIAAGYNSNAFYVSEDATSDYDALIAPGGSFSVLFGHSAFLEVDEDVAFVGYKSQSELNDVFTNTNGRFGFGSRRFLATVGGRYVNRRTRFNQEFDEPLQEKVSEWNASLDYILRPTTEIISSFRNTLATYGREEFVPTLQPPPPDTRTLEFQTQVQQRIRTNTLVAMELSLGKIDFLDLALDPTMDHESNFWNLMGGFEFTGYRLAGKALVGYGQTDALNLLQEPFNDLLIHTDVEYRIKNRMAIGAILFRQRYVSSLSESNFRLTTEGGIKGCFPISSKQGIFIDGRWIAGESNYESPNVPSAIVTKDTYQLYNAGINITLPRNLIIRLGTIYQRRSSNIDQLNKNRFAINFGLIFEAFTENDVRGCPNFAHFN